MPAWSQKALILTFTLPPIISAGGPQLRVSFLAAKHVYVVQKINYELYILQSSPLSLEQLAQCTDVHTQTAEIESKVT